MRSRLWHGFTDMSTVRDSAPFTLARGEGSYVFDDAGRRFLDATAGLWFCNVGHGRREIADAAAAQLARLAAYSTFGDYSNAPAEQLAERLSALSPTTDGAVFFTSGGSDSIDSAIKLVRRYWLALGSPERRVIVSRDHAYHGGHVGGTAIGGIRPDREGYGDLITDTARVRWDSSDDLERVLAQLGADQVAAFVVEPVIGAGGIRFAPDGYLSRVEAICRANDVILVADEVVTGFGRAGDWFACRRAGIEPDIVVCAKGLTSGYSPLGALIVGARVARPFYDGTAGPFNHGYTFSGNPGGAAVALVNIDVIERERLPDHVRSLEPALPGLMRSLEEHPLVEEVRTGAALMAAVELSHEALEERPDLPRAVASAMRDEGVLTRALMGGQLQFSPPLVVGPEQVTEFVDATLAALDSVSRS
jgi:putrescine---pyruvate transaminase